MLIKILENIYYNPVYHLAHRIFFPVSGVDLLEMMLEGDIVALYSYHGRLLGFRRLTIMSVQLANDPL